MATDKQKSRTGDRKTTIRNKKRIAKRKESRGPSGGDSNKFSRREMNLTAALYANKPRVVEDVRKTGKLPKRISMLGAEIGLRVLIERRGTEIKLTPDEKLVYDAILREKRLPGGGAILVDEHQ
jgi:hypothetical protein